MKTVTRTHEVVVDVPPRAAFDYVSDLTRHPEWSGGELKIKAVTPGPVQVGKEYISHGEVAIQKERPNRVRVSHFEPPGRFGFTAKDPSFGVVSHVFTFVGRNDGVLITRTMTLTLNPVLAFLFGFFIYPLIGRPSMDRAMTLLKAKLEATE